MHGVMGKPPGSAADLSKVAKSKVTLLLLVAMTGVAPISLYMLVPALPILATTFDSSISIAQMTVSLYMVGIALSQLIMGPLSDKFGRRPVLLAGLGLMVVAGIGSVFAQNLPELIAARFFQALGGASGMVISRAIIRDLSARARRRHDQPGRGRADDCPDGQPADRRSFGDRVRVACDPRAYHRGIVGDRRLDCAGIA
jgi:DHA1 family bicyclomycin/chloramphenicol resistance-like MFS transporter